MLNAHESHSWYFSHARFFFSFRPRTNRIGNRKARLLFRFFLIFSLLFWVGWTILFARLSHKEHEYYSWFNLLSRVVWAKALAIELSVVFSLYFFKTFIWWQNMPIIAHQIAQKIHITHLDDLVILNLCSVCCVHISTYGWENCVDSFKSFGKGWI